MLASTALCAQDLEREVLASTGTEVQLGSYTFEETVGDLVVVSGVAGASVFTQGFNQAYDLNVGVEDLAGGMVLTLLPNPTRDLVTITWEPDANGPMDLELRDVLGALVFSDHAVRQWPYVLDLSAYAAGPYYVRAMTTNGKAAVARVEKVR
jgi:hypothetical protein